MSKRALSIIFILAILICQTQSVSIINNEAVSSDFFQNMFLEKVRSGLNLSEFKGLDDLQNAKKCVRQLQEIANQFPSVKVAPFIDSWGKFPSGILYGHLRDLGNYDQCVKTSVEFEDPLGSANGKYCIATLPLGSPVKLTKFDSSMLQASPLESRIGARSSMKLKIAVCIPDICSPELITTVFQKISENVLNGTFAGVKVSGCRATKKPDFDAVDIFAIVLFSTFGGLMLLSTCYDYFTSYFERKPLQILTAFSVISNARKLFMINTKKSPNTIDCLNGMRVLSMIWVLHCHNYMFYATQNLINLTDILTWYKEFGAMSILMGTVSVDTFFFLSGLLVSYLGLRELDKTKGKINFLMMYFHRYIRLTPALAALILFYVSLNRHIGDGPYRDALIQVHSACDETWWSTLLYVQNYATPNKMCVLQSWYLAIDTQLYILAPWILLALWKWGKKSVMVLVVLILLSIGCIYGTFYSNGYTSLSGFEEPNRSQKLYFPTHTRYSPWVVGICLGYFMHVNRQRNLCPPMVIRIIGWILCLGTMLSIVYAPYISISAGHLSVSIGHAATYEALKRVSWSIALAWIVYACHFGFGGLVNSILSHPLWQPLGRLNYCMYLVHMAVQTINFGTARTDSYFSDYRLDLTFWSTFGISFLAAVVLSLSFEAPVLVIEKSIFSKGPSKPEISNGVASNGLASNKSATNGITKEV